jgi:hypothetical protein
MLDSTAFIFISTGNVDKVVDKRLLTSRERSIDAGFNKLPVQQAKS